MKSVENVAPRIYISVRFIDKVEGDVVRLNSVFEFFVIPSTCSVKRQLLSSSFKQKVLYGIEIQ